MKRSLIVPSAALLVLAGAALALPASADEKAPAKDRTKCEMTFSLKGWQAFYKTAKGEGKIICDNGQSADVRIRMTGGGITFGKSEIRNGTGKFSEVGRIDEVFGAYAAAGANAGAVKSSAASVLTKGEVSLALAGTGEGWDIGVDFGKFTIEKITDPRAGAKGDKGDEGDKKDGKGK